MSDPDYDKILDVLFANPNVRLDATMAGKLRAAGLDTKAGLALFHVKHHPQHGPKTRTCAHCSVSFLPTLKARKFCSRCDQKRRRAPGFKSSGTHANARSIANVAVKRGTLVKCPCKNCGGANAEKHHPDYSKPLEVVWLCRPCHMAEHKRMRAA